MGTGCYRLCRDVDSGNRRGGYACRGEITWGSRTKVDETQKDLKAGEKHQFSDFAQLSAWWHVLI